MKKLLLLSFLFAVNNTIAQEKFQLAPPLLKYESAFFTGSASFEVLFNQPGAEIRYTLNGKEPTADDQLYTGPVTISKRVSVKVRAIGEAYQPSETIVMEFIKTGKAIRQINFSTPNETYSSAKADILYDTVGGIISYRGGTWLGYDKDTAEIDISLKKNEKINSVLINMLVDENAWIFLPEQVLMYYFDKKRNAYLPAGKETFQHDEPSPKKCNSYEIRPTPKIKTDKIKLVFSVLKKIPEWHPGKGKHAWLFIDEIEVY
jgi:chitobiase/beta-hexosaminidase-like protein